MAHELNNPLTTIMGRAELMLVEADSGKSRRDLEQILTQGQRAAKIVQNLLSFARQTSPEMQLCDINEILRKVIEMLEHDFRVDDIEIQTELGPDLPGTMLDESQIQQVFVNIVNNAHQAIKEQQVPGRLTIRTGLDGDYLKVEFIDTGPGITVKQQEHIFEPFFTTKSKSKGTGLGLSISYGIVKAHGGHIDVKSVEGEGATFVIELPVVTGTTCACLEESRVVTCPKLDIQRVLIIDDEPSIVEVVTEILANEGCKVDAVTTGELALQKMNEETYDVILCDVRMPGMDGKEIYGHVERDMPQAARGFVFLTGDISDQTRSFLKVSGQPHLMKPFTREALLWTLKRTPLSKGKAKTPAPDTLPRAARPESIRRFNLRIAGSS